MKKTYTEMLKQLNKDWKDYIEEQKLYILGKSTNEIVDLLLNLEFLNPKVLEEEAEVETSNYTYNINLMGFEFDVEYKGNMEFEESNNFTIGAYETYDGGSSMSSWLINGDWRNGSEADGTSVDVYLWELELDSDYEDILDEIFNNFKLTDKIPELVKILKQEQKLVKNKSLFKNYNDTTIKVVVENNQAFVVFHDGEKIPFPSVD